MSNRYSPSKINTFNTCKLQYKYKYIDLLKSDLTTIERFMGSMVHDTLEQFYKFIKDENVKSVDWLLKYYKELWDKNYTDSIKVVKAYLTPKDYFKKGETCLIDYYNHYKPFNQAKIVDVEHMTFFTVRQGEVKHSFCGIIDRLDYDDKNNVFEIHDYKTSNRLMAQKDADNDWQLGLYYIAVAKKWPDVEKIKLIWHYLVFNKEIVSFRTEEQINELKKEVIKKIAIIESTVEFPPEKSALCNWCDFQNICPLWKHVKKMETVDVNEYKKDSGVKLVTQYKKFEEEKNELKEEICRVEEEQEKIEKAAIEFAEREHISVIDGPDAQLKIDIGEELRAPTKTEDEKTWWALRDFLIEKGMYNDVSTINNNMLNYKIRGWPHELVEKIKHFLIRKRKEIVKLIKK